MFERIVYKAMDWSLARVGIALLQLVLSSFLFFSSGLAMILLRNARPGGLANFLFNHFSMIQLMAALLSLGISKAYDRSLFAVWIVPQIIIWQFYTLCALELLISLN